MSKVGPHNEFESLLPDGTVLKSPNGYTVSIKPSGEINYGCTSADGSWNKGYEGLNFQHITGGNRFFLSRRQCYGKWVLAMNQDGGVYCTTDRITGGDADFEMIIHATNVINLRRTTAPKLFLGMDNKGNPVGVPEANETTDILWNLLY